MSFAAGLGISIFTGVFGALLNFGFAFSGPLQARCESLGARPMFATWAVWLLVLVAGFIPNLVYCGYLLFRNRTWSAYGVSTWPRAALMGLAMAILWLGGVFGYGVGSHVLRRVGHIVWFRLPHRLNRAGVKPAGTHCRRMDRHLGAHTEVANVRGRPQSCWPWWC